MILRFGTLTCCSLALIMTEAWGSPIPLVNPSFETPPAGGFNNPCAGTGCAFSETAIPGWTNSGASGQFNPGSNTIYFNFIPNGSVVAWDNDPGGTITQSAGTVAANTTYTLQVDLGQRNDGFYSLGTVQLLIGSTPVTAIGTAPTKGNWSTYTAVYNSVAGDVGKTITVQLTATGGQSDFDNVRLDASSGGTAIPEPATLALVGAGLVLSSILASRRRRPLR